MSLPSASGLHRAVVCIASTALPQVGSSSDAGTRGTSIHKFLETAGADRDAALKAVPADYRPFCEVLGDNLPLGAQYETEVGLCYDVETEKVRPRTPEVGPNEIGMRIDVVGVIDGVGHVIDYKTGKGWVPKAAVNWQLRVAALALARSRGLETVHASIIKLGDDGFAEWDTATFDSWDLATFAEDLRTLRRRIDAERELVQAKASPDKLHLNMGEHCRYCPAFTSCPAQGALIRRMAGEPLQVAEDLRALLTPETAAKAYSRVKLVRAALKAVETSLYAYAQENPITLEDGTVFGPTEKRVEELNANIVREVMTQMHGSMVADKACSFDTSKAGIERGIRSVYEARKAAGHPVTLKGLVEQVLERVREEGGAVTRVKTEVREHKVKDEQ